MARQVALADLIGERNWSVDLSADYGGRSGTAELTDPSFPLERADGAKPALVASGLTGRPYYRGPYEGGALFFHLEGVPDGPVPPERVITVLSQVIQAWPLPHHRVAPAFLTRQAWTVEDRGERLSARHPDGSTIEITFDELGRIARFGGQMQGR